MLDVCELFGDIDIYLFDQILKNRFSVEMNILDAGCGGGRNLIYFLRNGYRVFGIDQNDEAIWQVRLLAKTLAPNLPPENFQTSAVEKMPFPEKHFDAVISSAVLHFARNETHFNQMLGEMWRVLKPKGLFFARMASSIGIENRIKPVGGGRFLLPDGSERFLADEQLLDSLTNQLGGVWLEPLKTTNVQNLRCMTTWVLCKSDFSTFT
ncbi:MAG: class I SAM-dependent methyltransferase [Acidobacteriota bacterium]|jgi:SAM-dependent methyltransferase|nr:class I SAM-dependent methyltransferase [Acidobacteriota bacterium]